MGPKAVSSTEDERLSDPIQGIRVLRPRLIQLGLSGPFLEWRKVGATLDVGVSVRNCQFPKVH